jgi:GTP-binding protein YchF
MQIGIVGLPFSGKSTLFQTITRTHLDPSALARGGVHQAIVKLPDTRLDKLSALFSPKSTVFATVEFVDVAGLKKGDTGTTQFTTGFLTNVKTNDALVQVVRFFSDSAVPHPEGSVDPLRDIATFDTEFILSDLSVIETRLERITKQIQKAGDERVKKELPVLERCRDLLEKEHPLRNEEFSRDEQAILKTYQLLSIKPMLIALNCDEGEREAGDGVLARIADRKRSRQTNVLSFFGKIEQELSELPPGEAEAFMAEYGIQESALDALIRESYALLGLQSFFTVGEDECRAWTIRTGMTAQEAAGVIHSDFVNKFIRAEVVGYDQFMAHGGSFQKLKEAGLWRLEGKEYVVQDGDILSIRHS